MLDNVFNEINKDLEKEQSRQDFYDLLHEDIEFNSFIDENLLKLSENGVNNAMLKNEMPFLFIEDTTVDEDLITNLQHEVDYEDSFNRKPIYDLDTTTRFQEPVDYDDNFSASYTSDVEADTYLNREIDYSDNQRTPVNIDEFSNEDTDFFLEMEDMESFMEAECDMTVPNKVNCPDCGDTIDQADEADVYNTEYPNRPEGVVMEEDEEFLENMGIFDEAEGMDTPDMEDDMGENDISSEDFFEEDFLFEAADDDDEDEDDEEEDDEDDEEEDDEDDEEEEDDEDDDDEDEDDEEEDDDDEDCDSKKSKGKKSESYSIFDFY